MGKFFRLYGRNSVSERLKADPQSIQHLILDREQGAKDIEHLGRAKGIPIRYLSAREFEKISRNIRSQGIIAEVEGFTYSDFEDMFNQSKEKVSTLLFLDNLNDPQNLGSILRTAACLGGFAVVLPKHDSVEITEAVLRVASGGENYVPVAQVTNLSSAITEAKKKGYWIAGAVVKGGENLTKAILRFPLGLVIGSEAKGIRLGLLKQLDFTFTIPVEGAQLSLNVAIAAALFCYEALRQRK